MKSGPEQRDEDFTWEVKKNNNRFGYVLKDEQGNYIGSIYQSVIKPGKWGFHNQNHSKKLSETYDSPDEAKDALLIDLGI